GCGPSRSAAYGGGSMKPISRRIRRLEEAFRVLPPTEEEKELMQRIEEGHRRVEESRARGELEPAPEWEPRPPGLGVVEILHLRRQRAREQDSRATQRRS